MPAEVPGLKREILGHPAHARPLIAIVKPR